MDAFKEATVNQGLGGWGHELPNTSHKITNRYARRKLKQRDRQEFFGGANV